MKFVCDRSIVGANETHIYTHTNMAPTNPTTKHYQTHTKPKPQRHTCTRTHPEGLYWRVGAGEVEELDGLVGGARGEGRVIPPAEVQDGRLVRVHPLLLRLFGVGFGVCFGRVGGWGAVIGASSRAVCVYPWMHIRMAFIN
jgi:hypothetical protein